MGNKCYRAPNEDLDKSTEEQGHVDWSDENAVNQHVVNNYVHNMAIGKMDPVAARPHPSRSKSLRKSLTFSDELEQIVIFARASMEMEESARGSSSENQAVPSS